MKSTFSFDDKASEKLDNIAERSAISKKEVLRRAITLYDILEQRKNADNTIIIKNSDGKETEIVLP